MDTENIFEHLLELADQVGIEVRQVELGGGGGGICQLRGQWVLFVDRSESLTEQIANIALVLSKRKEINDLYIIPQVRELLDQYR